MSTGWDPDQYLRFSDERGRPFWDLVGRVPVDSPRLVVDLGCGPGNLTARLVDRWPDARVVGVDSSEEMISQASERAAAKLSFMRGDVRTWEPAEEVDVLLSNATLQWVPDHASLFERFLGFVRAGGVFAFQVPGNFGFPSHVLLHELAGSERWGHLMAPALEAAPSSLEPSEYLERLLDAGASTVDVWETTYLHLLNGSTQSSSGSPAPGCGRSSGPSRRRPTHRTRRSSWPHTGRRCEPPIRRTGRGVPCSPSAVSLRSQVVRVTKVPK